MTIETPDIIMGDYRVGLVQTLDASALLSLYESVGWSTYTQDRDGLVAAVDGCHPRFEERGLPHRHRVAPTQRGRTDGASRSEHGGGSYRSITAD